MASETSGRCLCSNDLDALNAKTGETYSFYATFAAPPAGVTELEVTVPRFGAIPRVPVHVAACPSLSEPACSSPVCWPLRTLSRCGATRLR